MKIRIAGIIVLVLFLLMTNRWVAYDDLPKIMDTPDVHDYMTISFAAPALPSERMVFHRAQRFAIPFCLGIIAQITGISQETIFLFITLLCCGTILFFFHRILINLGLSDSGYLLCVSLLIMNPYVFRMYFMLPGMLSDLAFVCGLTLIVLGLLDKKFLIVFAGITIASFARQTALALLPGLFFWFFWADGWEQKSLARKLMYLLVIVLCAFGIYQFTGRIARGFSTPNTNLIFITGIFSWLRTSFVTSAFLEFLLRLAMPHLFVICVLAGLLRKQISFPKEFWMLLILAASITTQPLLAGPHVSVGGVVRLSSFGFVPLLVAFAILVRHNQLFFDSHILLFALLQILIAGASFHHVFSLWGGDSSNATRFVQMYLAFALAAGVISFFSWGSSTPVNQA